MKLNALVLAILAIAPHIAMGDSYATPSPREAFSADGQMKAEVAPPVFKEQTSYGFFQRENFLAVNALEGPDIGGKAQVRVSLSRVTIGTNYLVIWSRFCPKTDIPTQIFLLQSNNLQTVVLEGRYGERQGATIPFTVFDYQGRCVTNSSFPSSFITSGNLTNHWRFDGQSLELLGQHGTSSLTVEVGTTTKRGN